MSGFTKIQPNGYGIHISMMHNQRFGLTDQDRAKRKARQRRKEAKKARS
tara:strand:- start:4436 stop:4582 length:147 start_codon:yes stop_codon:yes gene_type:complete